MCLNPSKHPGPTYERGDIWSRWNHTHLLLVTTNSDVKKDGSLVMGAGIARQARDRFPGIERAFGARVQGYGPSPYGLLVSERWPVARLGAFQSKISWRDPASETVIALGVEKLIAWCRKNYGCRVDLAAPGIGLGNLSFERMEELVRPLPTDVHIWTR